MKVKLTDVVNAVTALQNIGKIRMPANLSFTFQRNLRILQPDIIAFEEARTNLIKENGIENVDGTYKLDPSKVKAVNDELDLLLQEEVDVNVRKILISDIQFDVAPNDLYLIEWMLTETVGKKAKKGAKKGTKK